MANCKIDVVKGDCTGRCAEGEACSQYQVVYGGPDPHPQQQVYAHDENKTEWKCKCVASLAEGIDEMNIDSFTRDNLVSRVARLSIDEKLDNLFQKRITQEMLEDFSRLNAHGMDCVFGVLNYLKLVPRQELLNVACQHFHGASIVLALDFFSENRDNNLYGEVNLPIADMRRQRADVFFTGRTTVDIPGMIRLRLAGIVQRIKDNHAVIFGIIRAEGLNHVMILMKLHGILMLVDPQYSPYPGFPLLIVGEDNIIVYLLDGIDELFVVVRYGHEFWFGPE